MHTGTLDQMFPLIFNLIYVFFGAQESRGLESYSKRSHDNQLKFKIELYILNLSIDRLMMLSFHSNVLITERKHHKVSNVCRYYIHTLLLQK